MIAALELPRRRAQSVQPARLRLLDRALRRWISA
jgi:hypothetical protein